MGNLGAQKAKRNDTPISAKKDIMGDKTVRVRADLHHIIKIETAKNGGNVKEVMEIRLINILKFCVMIARIANNGEALRYSSPNKLDSMIFIKKFEKQVTEVFVTFCQKVTFL